MTCGMVLRLMEHPQRTACDFFWREGVDHVCFVALPSLSPFLFEHGPLSLSCESLGEFRRQARRSQSCFGRGSQICVQS